MADISNTVSYSTDLNVDPYYDDYNEEKNFHQILFRPGLAVQARELTQLQTILQKQTSRFGAHIFKEGTIVSGGSKQLKIGIPFVKITDKDNGNNALTMTTLVGSTVTGGTTGVTAEVIATVSGVQTAANTNTLYVKYTNSGTNKTTKTFSAGEVLSFVYANTGTANATVASSANTPTGNGVFFQLSDALVFAKGQFILHSNSGIVVERYNETPSQRIGFKVNENIITSNTDTTLLDPAQGSYNYTAPGANRLKLSTELTILPLSVTGDAPASNGFFELLNLDNGLRAEEAKQPDYADLGQEMARRTFQESGHYTTKAFKFNVRENLIDGTNLGLKTSAAGGDANTLSVGIEGGHAFVKGFEYDYENIDTIYVDVAKGTNTQLYESISTTPNYGQYVLANEVSGVLDPTNLPEVSLRNAAAKSHTNKTFDNTASPGSQIGTARLRMISQHAGNTDTAGGQFKLHLGEIKLTSGQFANVKSFYIANAVSGASKNFLADAVLTSANSTFLGNATLNEPTNDSLVYSLPFKGVKTIRDDSNSVETSFQFKKSFDITIATNGTASIATGASDHQFTTTGTLSASQKDSLVTLVAKNQVTSTQLGTVLANSTTTTVTGTGTKFNLLKAGDRVRLGPSNIFTVNAVTSNVAMSITTTPTAAQNVASGNAISKVIESGQLIDLSMTGTGGNGADRTFTISSTTAAALDIKETLNTTLAATAIVTLNKVNAREAAKSLSANVFVRINPNTHFNKTGNGPYPLGVTDAVRLRKVYMSTSNVVVANTSGTTDITSRYKLDSGMKAGHYDIASIILKAGQTAPTGQLLVNFDHFKHSSSLGQGYFSVDSYPVDDTKGTNSVTSIKTFEIPIYTNPSTGDEYNLRNSIDIRPNKANTANPTTTISSSPINPANSSSYTVAGDGQFLPITGENILKDLQIYLGRTDKIVVNEDGRIVIKTGISSEAKVPPTVGSDEMTLAVLDIPPYPSISPFVAKINEREDLQVTLTPMDNRRFTMRDIGQLAQRVTRLEYYTSLSMLEKDSQSLQILDSAGLDRFKNGILVDNFTGHGVGEVVNEDYKAAIDPDKTILRPSFKINNIDYIANTSGTTNVIRRSRDVMMKVSNSQLADDISMSFNETVTGSTSGSTGRLKYITGANTDIILLENETGSGFTAGETVTGSTSGFTATISIVKRPNEGPLATLDYDQNDLIVQPFVSTEFRISSAEFNDFVGTIELTPDFDNWVDTETKPDLVINHEGNYDNWQTLTDAWGTQWGDWNTIVTGSVSKDEFLLEDLGNYSTSTPLSGGRTQVNTYDNKKLLAYESVEQRMTRTGIKIKATPYINKESIGDRVVDVNVTPYIRSKNIEFTARGLRPSTRVYAFFDNEDVTTFIKPSGGTLGGSLFTDAAGTASGEFRIPNTSTLKFRIGAKPFVLTDSSTNSTTDFTTIASATYHTQGLSTIQQETILSTREPIFSQEELTQSRTEFQDVMSFKHKNDLISSVINSPAPPCRRGCRRGCFLEGTPVTMADGSVKHIQDIQLGEKVLEGGMVYAVAKFLINDLYDYEGVFVAGSHAVKENNKWVRVEDSKKGIKLDNGDQIVYTLGNENKRIMINNIEFTDYFEVAEQEEFFNEGEEYFDTWTDKIPAFEKEKIDTLNA